MMPRFTRLVLFLSTLSLLILPMGNEASATDTPGTITGTVVAGAANTCHPPDPGPIPISLSHRRCVGGSFSDVIDVELVATRVLPTPDVAVCSGSADDITFTTRETTAEGRGRIDDTHLVLSEGAQECRVRISGRFHRVGTVAVGRLGIDVHRADGTFRHSYCANFEATAVPVIGTPTTVVTAAVEGIQNLDANCAVGASTGVPPDGRLPIDSDDPQHHDTLVLPTVP